jgi:putative tryptophan/tyrosine transport system substrate-binding protein
MQFGHLKRREFITLISGAAVVWPLLVRAQHTGKLWRICYLSAVSRESSSLSYAALQQGMRDLGYVEGKDFVLEWRSVEGKYERFSEIMAELVRLKVDVIVTGVTAALPALQRATSTIPIVMAYSTDPVGNGLVASLAHPGGNITGLRAQQPPIPVIGFLSGGTPAGLAHLSAAFRQGLSEAGHVEGQKKTDVERRDS